MYFTQSKRKQEYLFICCYANKATHQHKNTKNKKKHTQKNSLKKYYKYSAITASFMPFCRVMLCKRGLRHYAVCVCLSVCVSVTFVHSVKTNKHIYKFFSPVGSQAILVFPYQTGWRYSNGNPPNGGVECKGV